MATDSGRWHGHVHYIDWLKVLTVAGVFLFHVAMIFSITGWLINDRQRSLPLSALAGFLFLFGVPLLFLLAGAASRFGLVSRTPAQFIRARTNRLLIPLLIGLAVLSPLQAYLVQVAAGGAPWLPSFAAQFFLGVRLSWTPRVLYTYGYHLWFLGYYFAYSVLAVPLFMAARHGLGARVISMLARMAGRPGGLLLFALPVVVTQVALRPRWPAYQDWADFVAYLCFFLLGWLLFTDPRFQEAIRRRAGSALLGGIACSLAIGIMALAGSVQVWEPHPDRSVGCTLYLVLRSVDAWSWLVVVLNLGQRAFQSEHPLVTYGNDALMPFYVLHHPVVLAVAVVVIRLDAGVYLKFWLIAVVAFVITVGLYELLVRRSDPMRRLFGMKPRHPHPRAKLAAVG